MKTDRELLELAARAAGVEQCGTDSGKVFYYAGRDEPWDPLTDDGDSLRLAVKLGLALDRTSNRCWVYGAGMAINGVCEEFYKDDPYAATRRAIVRAAAAIGETMQ